MATEYAADVEMVSFDFSSFLLQNSTLRTLLPFVSDQGPITAELSSKDSLGVYGVSKPTNMISALRCAFQRGNHMALRVPPSDSRYSACIVGIFSGGASEPAPSAVIPGTDYYLGIAPLYSSDDLYVGSGMEGDVSPIYRNGGLPLNLDKYDAFQALDEAGDNFYIANPAKLVQPEEVTDYIPTEYPTTRLIEPLALVYRNGTGIEGNAISLKITSENVAPIEPVLSHDKFVGGNLPAGTYTYTRAPVTANGIQYSSMSPPYSVTLGSEDIEDGIRAIRLEWELDDPSVRGIMIYRQDTVNAELRLVAELSRVNTTFIDDTLRTGTLMAEGATNGPIALPLLSTRDAVSQSFMLQVFNNDTLVENIPFSFNVEMRDGAAMPIDEAINTISSEIRSKRLYEYDRIQGEDIPVLFSTPKVELTGGFNGINAVGQEDLARALKPFLNRDRYRISAIGDLGWCSQWATYEFAKVCDAQRAHALLGMPREYQSAQAGVSYAASLSGVSRRQSIYTPWMYRRDPDTQSKVLIVGSAFAVQAMLQSDAATTGGAGRAFAGLNRGVVDAMGVEFPDQYEYDDTERDLMARGLVNYFRKKPNVGMVLWEQWTLQRNLSAASYVNVSRIWDIIQNSVHDYLEYSLYEPNDEFNVKEIRAGLNEYLQGHVRTRNLGNFQIVTDGRAGNNNSTADQGVRNIDIYLTPVIATRRYKCRTILTRQGANYEDLMQVM